MQARNNLCGFKIAFPMKFSSFFSPSLISLGTLNIVGSIKYQDTIVIIIGNHTRSHWERIVYSHWGKNYHLDAKLYLGKEVQKRKEKEATVMMIYLQGIDIGIISVHHMEQEVLDQMSKHT